MRSDDHDNVVRRSFSRQVGIFSGADSVFALRAPSALAWLGPLDPDFALLDVACGAARPSIRVIGLSLHEDRHFVAPNAGTPRDRLGANSSNSLSRRAASRARLG